LGKKEYLQKELDLILEKLRFWRYIIIGVVSGVIGMFYKGVISINSIILSILGLITLFFAIKRIDTLTKEYKNLLEQLKEEE
jgi:sulfite exporter TauE/SafE